MLRVFLCAIYISSCFLRAGSQNDAGYGPPRLLFENSDTKEINENDSFNLECESDKPVYWIYPKLSVGQDAREEGYDTVVNISDSVTPNGLHHSVLSVISANYLDTGFYSCIANESSTEHASIYVFVKDSVNLLVKNESFIVLAVTQYQPAVIPCRPTSLEVNVVLFRDGIQVELGIQASDHMNVSFDPKVGFILKPINLRNAGIYECCATLGDEEERIHCHIDVLMSISTTSGSNLHELVASSPSNNYN